MADPQIGQLWTPSGPLWQYPHAKQPGGIGTPVTDPTQPPIQSELEGQPPQPPAVDPTPRAEKNGLYYPGCGHSIMEWEVVRASVGGVPSALICCPICRYIQQIFTPYTLLDAIPYIFD